jgi:hypothetical protein
MRTSGIIASSLMLAWPLQVTPQDMIRPPDDAVASSGGHDAITALAPETTSEDLSNYLGVARPIVVFGDAPDDPRVEEQLDTSRNRCVIWPFRDSLARGRSEADDGAAAGVL